MVTQKIGEHFRCRAVMVCHMKAGCAACIHHPDHHTLHLCFTAQRAHYTASNTGTGHKACAADMRTHFMNVLCKKKKCQNIIMAICKTFCSQWESDLPSKLHDVLELLHPAIWWSAVKHCKQCIPWLEMLPLLRAPDKNWSGLSDRSCGVDVWPFFVGWQWIKLQLLDKEKKV